MIEILSESTKKKDSYLKLMKYQNAGVREYWLVDPEKKKVIVYDFEQEEIPKIYGFDTQVPVGIFGGECKVDFAKIYEEIRFIYEKEENRTREIQPNLPHFDFIKSLHYTLKDVN